MLIYDCEIIKAIPSKKEAAMPEIEYCQGWTDFANMGISVIGAYDSDSGRFRVFCQDNFQDFQDLVDKHDVIVGYNSIAFDNKLCAAHGINVPDEKSYDLLVEIWQAAGLGPVFQYPTHMGFSLDAVCKFNLCKMKSGDGALAPVLWQRGKIGSVIDYCLNDVHLTLKLFQLIARQRWLHDPRDPSRMLVIHPPVSHARIFDQIETVF